MPFRSTLGLRAVAVHQTAAHEGPASAKDEAEAPRTKPRALVRRARLLAWSTLSLLAACSSKGDDDAQEPDDSVLFFDDEVEDVLGNGDAEGGSSQGPLRPGNTCAGQVAGTEVVPAMIELVVDTSGSMNFDAPGSNDSKWEVTRDVLLETLDLLPEQTATGLVFYPDQDTGPGNCFDEDEDVSIGFLGEAGSIQRRRLNNALRGQDPEGGTPTHDALSYALGRLERADGSANRFAVVITDGTPTFSQGCVGTGRVEDPVDRAPLITEAGNALAERDIRTFVIGSPGSEDARRDLSRMASAGGTAGADCSHDGPNYCHFDMTGREDFAQGLRDALGAISGLALSCSYDVPDPPGGGILEPGLVNVIFTDELGEPVYIRQDRPGSCNEGWQYSEDQSRILLCGDTCEQVRNSSGQLSLEFGCSTLLR